MGCFGPPMPASASRPLSTRRSLHSCAPVRHGSRARLTPKARPRPARNINAYPCRLRTPTSLPYRLLVCLGCCCGWCVDQLLLLLLLLLVSGGGSALEPLVLVVVAAVLVMQ
jgi:hypothetical protein